MSSFANSAEIRTIELGTKRNAVQLSFVP